MNRFLFVKQIKSYWIFELLCIIVPAAAVIAMVAVGDVVNGVKIVSDILDAVFFASIALEMSAIFIIVAGNGMVTGDVQKGTITYTATSGIGRWKIINTKIVYFALYSLLFFIINLIIILPTVSAQKTDVNAGLFAMKMFGFMLLLLATSGFMFIISSIFNKSVLTFSIGGGVIVFFILMSILSQIDSIGKYVKYLTINTLFYVEGYTMKNGKLDLNPTAILGMIILGGIGIGTYVGSAFIFTRKDLPL